MRVLEEKLTKHVYSSKRCAELVVLEITVEDFSCSRINPEWEQD